MSDYGENRRDFFRLSLSKPLCGRLELHSLKGKTLNSKMAYICLKDIGGGGVLFQSNLKLPVTDDLVLKFFFEIDGINFQVQGIILRRTKIHQNQYEYGVRFIDLAKNSQFQLVSAINKMNVQLKRNALSGCSMCSLQTECYMRKNEKMKMIGV